MNERLEIERVMFDEVLEKMQYPKAQYRSSNVSALKTAENMYRVNVKGTWRFTVLHEVSGWKHKSWSEKKLCVHKGPLLSINLILN